MSQTDDLLAQERTSAWDPGQIKTPAEHAAELVRDGLFICSNGTVYAIVGDALNPKLQDRIVEVKGSGRGAAQPVGWTVPFDHPTAARVFDTSQIKSKKLRRLIDCDPDELTSRLGALAFLRGPANMKRKAEKGIPDCIIPLRTKTVQIYSPIGNAGATDIIEAIIRAGGEPVMTSANLSGSPEITTEHEIFEFQKRTGLPLLQMINHATGPPKFQSSYPVLDLRSDGFVPIRTGWLSLEIIERLLDGYPMGAFDPAELPAPSNPAMVLTLKDLPNGENLYGAELRDQVLQAIGVDVSVRSVLLRP